MTALGRTWHRIAEYHRAVQAEVRTVFAGYCACTSNMEWLPAAAGCWNNCNGQGNHPVSPRRQLWRRDARERFEMGARCRHRRSHPPFQEPSGLRTRELIEAPCAVCCKMTECVCENARIFSWHSVALPEIWPLPSAARARLEQRTAGFSRRMRGSCSTKSLSLSVCETTAAQLPALSLTKARTCAAGA